MQIIFQDPYASLDPRQQTVAPSAHEFDVQGIVRVVTDRVAQ